MTRSCVVVSTPSFGACDDGSPCGLLKGIGDGARRLSESLYKNSEEEDDLGDVGISPTRHG